MKYQRPKGTADILPGQSASWQYVEEKMAEVLDRYNFEEIRTPLFESYELFARGVGEGSDIVSKEMYDFKDKGDRHMALRPEGTASAVRAYVENKLYGPEYPKPVKLYYIGPMFRYERPQGGRMRQFHQLGVESFGSNKPETDVETMTLALDLFKSVGIDHLSLTINSLGDEESRQAYLQALKAYLEPHLDDLSKDSQRRFEQNTLRILDSKDKADQEIVAKAPSILDYLSEESKAHFQAVQDLLKATNISFEVDHRMVRGLDYYTGTVFEIMTDSKVFGSITTVCAGGRYNKLVEEVGGPETPAFGFAMGLERLLLVLEAENIDIPQADPLDVYVVGIGDKVSAETFKVVQALRQQGLKTEKDFAGRKAKAQFKTADRLNAKTVMILGEDELDKGKITVREMSSGNQEEIPLESIYNQDFIEKYRAEVQKLKANEEEF